MSFLYWSPQRAWAQGHSSTTDLQERVSVYQTVSGRILDVRERSTVRKENFPYDRNLSDEVLHIPEILIGLDPLSC